MKNAIDDLCFNYYLNKSGDFESTNITNNKYEIELNKTLLKKKLNRKQKKLLLRIIDAKDLIKEETKQESFIEGFKLGLKVGYESNKD